MSLTEWVRAPGYLSCERCVELKKSVGKTPDCDACKMPKILPANKQSLFILQNYFAGISNGYGGLVLSEIITACGLENILPHSDTIKKIFIYFNEINKKDANG